MALYARKVCAGGNRSSVQPEAISRGEGARLKSDEALWYLLSSFIIATASLPYGSPASVILFQLVRSALLSAPAGATKPSALPATYSPLT